MYVEVVLFCGVVGWDGDEYCVVYVCGWVDLGRYVVVVGGDDGVVWEFDCVCVDVVDWLCGCEVWDFVCGVCVCVVWYVGCEVVGVVVCDCCLWLVWYLDLVWW